VVPSHSAALTREDGDCNAVMTKTLTFTDFPLPEITLYFQNNTIFLPYECRPPNNEMSLLAK
jgi:hypothetical protein